MWSLAGLVVVGTVIVTFLHWLSYSFLKQRIVAGQRWDLNICCGTMDGGGVNADIMKHADLPNFVQIDDIYRLPFDDLQFDTVLCSHTAEHVDDPDGFDQELQRVGRQVVYVLPPIWDLAACLNVLEHRWVFLSLGKTHNTLPPRVRLPLARRIQHWLGQKIAA